MNTPIYLAQRRHSRNGISFIIIIINIIIIIIITVIIEEIQRLDSWLHTCKCPDLCFSNISRKTFRINWTTI